MRKVEWLMLLWISLICAILFVRFLHQVDYSMGKTILVVEPENNLDRGRVNLKEDRVQCRMSWKFGMPKVQQVATWTLR